MSAAVFSKTKPNKRQKKPKDGKKMKLKKLRGTDINEDNTRVLALIKASDDGRKRSTVLPPLEREATFQRKPKFYNPNEKVSDDAGESHWNKKYAKVSIEVDKKIVSHLRKQLNKRIEKRLHAEYEDGDSSDGDHRHGKGYEPWAGKKSTVVNGTLHSDNGDVFRRYTETGDKYDPGSSQSTHKDGSSRKSSLKKAAGSDQALPSISPHKQNGTVSPEDKKPQQNGHEPFKGPLPDISLPVQNGDVVDSAQGIVSENVQAAQINVLGDLELESLNSDNEEEVESFRELHDISPVQTPVVYRPLTREQTRLSLSDRMTRVLKGQVHRACPETNRTVRLYISSGFADSEAEKTVLMERVYPELRSICGRHGRDLEIHDLHWGLKDDTLDDHSLPDLCMKTLEKCVAGQPQSLGIEMLVLLTDKYGQYMLPANLPQDEFEAIYNVTKAYRERHMEDIQSKLADIEGRPEPDDGKLQQQQQQDADTESTTTTDLTSESRAGLARSGSVASSQNESSVTEDGDRYLKPPRKAQNLKKEQQLIKALKEKENALPDPSLLLRWYQLDENAIPPHYTLQNVSSVYRDFVRGDKTSRQVARGQWIETRKALVGILQEFSKRVISDPFALKKYFKSLLDLELEHGVLETDTMRNHCLVVKRRIMDINNNMDDESISEFIDVLPSNAKRPNRAAADQLGKMTEELLPQKVDANNTLTFDITWAPDGIRVGGDRSHQTYLDRMSKQVLDGLRKRLEEAFRHEEKSRDESSKLFDEVSHHVNYCQTLSKEFQGRKETLQTIKSYLRSSCHSPLILHGNPGCGKSALLAKTAREVHKWYKGTSVAVLVRMIGVTMRSTNVRTLLRSLCRQLCSVYDLNMEEIPTEYVGIVNDFAQKLTNATADTPVVILIDSLDRLSEEYNGRKMAWLPKVLPEHVHIIVSTLPDERFECMTSLKTTFDGNEDAFLEVPELPEQDAVTILEHLFNIHNRTVTSEQYDAILTAFSKAPTPLFLHMAFRESLSWASYTKPEQTKLLDSVKKMAAFKLGKLESKHGEALVRRAVGYITASRSGITDTEMLDLLSLDDAIMGEIQSMHSLSRRRLPAFLWIRLKEDLSPFLRECCADNVRTLQWSHAHFFEAAEERYLNQRDKAPSYHKAMSEYFMGMWTSKPKPYPGNDKGVLRYVSDQPLLFERKNPKDEDDVTRIYNLRKVNELPHHLIRSQQTQLYKSEAMCNFEWVLAKLCGTSLGALLEEYQIGLQLEPGDADLKMLSDTLQLSANALLTDPRQLASQMLGRMQGIILKDVPSTPGDPPKYPFLHALVAQAKSTSVPALIPSIGCLTEPGGILFDLLSGHTKPITAATISSDGRWAITSSLDNSIKIWDLKSGKVVKTFEGVGAEVSKIRTASNNKYLVTVEGSVIKIWLIRTEQCQLVVDQFLDPPVITIAAEGRLLVAIFEGVNIMRTWDLSETFQFVVESKIENHGVFKDNSVVLSPNSYGDYILHAFRGGNFATIRHARTGKVIHTLNCHDTSSSVVALAITRDYMVVACRQHYMKLHEIHQLELFDAKKGKYLRSVRGCTHDIITELHINFVGSHAIAVCASEAANASNVAIWNLETEDHKHLARHAGVSNISACGDFRYCLTAKKGDNTLKVWNVSSKVNQPMPRLKKSLGVAEIYPMVDNPRYVIARQVNHGPISIWNVAKAKCLQSAVRIERGLSESTDVVLVRNTKVYILTEKGLKESRPVFKTVLVFDLQLKKYVTKLENCFIVPSPAHEYVILDDEHLLGPADTRNHFIIWSLSTGREMFRIRPKFNVFDRKTTISDADLNHSLQTRCSTAKMTPWDRRTETSSAKKRRREKEKEEERKNLEELRKERENGIEQYMVSENQQVIVASFYAHHLCVFDIPTKLHTQTLENEHSMLFLHVAALNYDGSHLVHANYDEHQKTSYVTLWDTTTGQVKKRLKNETDVLAIAITNDASRIVFGKANNELRIWDPDKKDSMRRINGYKGLNFDVHSKIFMLNGGERAVVFAGDISLWDINKAVVLAVFTPDTRIQTCNVAMGGQLITFGVHEFPELVILKLTGKDARLQLEPEGADLFGESTGDTSDEDEDDEDL